MIKSGWLKFLSVSVAAAGLGAVYLLEKKRPLRRRVESPAVNLGRNLATAALAGAVLELAEKPLTGRLTRLVEEKRIGLLPQLGGPRFWQVAAAVLLLDYTLYLWHRLTHRVPFLWRFHLVHHLDLDLTAATAFRFHFGEILLSVGWRAGQILLIGVSDEAFKIWQKLLFVSIVFHHSNIELPVRVENLLKKFVMTPRLHGVHHSVVRAETDSNWSSGLTLWDRLHGTFRDAEPNRPPIVGVPAHREKVGLAHILRMPFGEQKDDWRTENR